MFKCVILPPNRCDRGVDLPIPMTINSSSFGLLSVNEAQDLMCLKFKAFLMNKQHPSGYTETSIVELETKIKSLKTSYAEKQKLISEFDSLSSGVKNILVVKC